MKILVLGATGGTGRALVGQALARGHDVVVVVRSPQKLGVSHKQLTIVVGDPIDVPTLTPAVNSVDAIVTALGPRGIGRTTIYSDSARAILAALAGRTVRVIAVTAALHFPLHPWAWAPFRFLARFALRDGRVLEQALQDSPLDWTIVRPPRLLDSPGMGRYRTAMGTLPRGGGVLSRADLGLFLADELERGQFRNTLVGVCQ